jgi:hypothetical protein
MEDRPLEQKIQKLDDAVVGTGLDVENLLIQLIGIRNSTRA